MTSHTAKNEALADWLDATLPHSVSYRDAANLCMTLFCTVEPLPPPLRTATWTKENLAEAFALFTHRRFDSAITADLWSHGRASFHGPTEVAHWLDVQASALTLPREPNFARAAAVVAPSNVT